MKTLDKKYLQRVKKVANRVEFTIELIPGLVASEDMFLAKHSSLSISCYGPTEKIARQNAREEVISRLLKSTKLLEDLS